MVHEVLETRNFGDGAVAEGVERIIGQLAFAHVGANPALGIGGGEAAEGERSAGGAAIERAVGVFHAEDAAEDGGVGNFDVGQETLGPVAAVEEHALVVVVRVIIIPIHQRGGRAAGQLHGVHGEHTGHIHFAGAGQELVAHHAHERADVAAKVLLHGGPALDGGGVNGVGIHPVGEDDAELGHLDEFGGRHARGGRVAGDFRQLGFHGGGLGIELVGLAEEFGEIDGGDADAVALEQFFRVTDSIKRAGTGTDGPQTHAAHAVDHPAHAEELRQISDETGGCRVRHVLAGEGELDAGLHQVVAHGNLAAIGIAPAGGGELGQIVGVALDEHRHIKLGQFERVGYALFVAEVRQADEDAVDFTGVPAEEFGAFAGVGMGLDAAELGVGFGELDGFDAEFGEEGGDVPARLGDELVGEKVAVAVDDAEHGRFAFDRVHVQGIVVPREFPPAPQKPSGFF